jgi:hypothetical protein
MTITTSQIAQKQLLLHGMASRQASGKKSSTFAISSSRITNRTKVMSFSLRQRQSEPQNFGIG